MELLTWLPLAFLIVLLAIAFPAGRYLKRQRPDIAKNITYFCGGFIACHLLEMMVRLIVKGHL